IDICTFRVYSSPVQAFSDTCLPGETGMRISAAFKLPTIGILSALLLVCTLTANAAGLCVPGQAVEVLYAGQWYPARVIEGPDNSGTCKISYDGYGSNWDEWVNAQRLRPAANVAAPA